MAKSTTYTVSDGKLTLTLRAAEGGWFAVSSPLDPELHTQAKTIDDAFAMAYDAKAALHAGRKKRLKLLASA